ncbi:MAG TPA: SDR family NAD(P)-dependent oxidoreductase [Polyangiaceae bacterium]|nr:SDR family NAD(P)-dependent oxidoreductase [Polyangiaceae bacterium]
MTDELRFEDKVVIVTGAGGGLGRSHALLFGSRGAKVVVNDLGGSAHGEGKSSAMADEVVTQIKDAGGEAVASYDSVEDGDKIVQTALDTFGRVDVVVNNAGILRDVSFHKMSDDDWDLVYRVHVLGSYAVTKAAWPHLRDQRYGRIVMTASAAGIYGNFGQANYAMAKLGLTGFANTLAVEGRKRNIFVNTIAPIAGSRLTETVLPQELIEALDPAYVSPLVAYLCHESCEETGGLFEVGGGFFGKLRWERAQGKIFRVGRPISPEDVQRVWPTVVDFARAEHPDSINASMQPIMENIQRGKSKGGNEFIDVDEALGYVFPEATSSYDARDVALYALGVGAATDPLDADELKLVYELDGGFVVLPTYGVVPAVNVAMEAAKRGETVPGLNYGLDRLLHGEQYTEVRRPLPTSAKLTHKSRIKDIFDKGKGALIVTATESLDEEGEVLIYNESTAYIRGAGGWGGDRGPSSHGGEPPSREPDAVVREVIPPHQALLYRLSGDWNPLHADPAFAKAFGFDKPILHGLCTFGYAGRHVIKEMAPDGDARFFRSIRVRFADNVYPGDTLVTEMWRESDQRVIFQCRVEGREGLVISHAAIEFYETIPVKVAAEQTAADSNAAPSAVPSEPTSADIFTAIGYFLAENPGRGDKIQTVFQFGLSDPDSVWTVDASSGDGSVSAGETAKPDCTLELSDQDFMDMCTGKADPQKLYFGGQLKIGGNIMASQKLTFLQKVTPEMVQRAMAERATAPAMKAVAQKKPKREPSAAALFKTLAGQSERVQRLGGKVQFCISDPESAWVVNGSDGSVTEGEAEDAVATFTLTDADLSALFSGESARSLFMHGKLRVDGDLGYAQKLDEVLR